MTIENEILKNNTSIPQKTDTKKIAIIFIGLFAIATIIIWQIPSGNFILYPFTILGTWFHEMGHGIMAVILGGKFHSLELYPDGSGVATYSGNLLFGNIGKGLVAFAGPLGPTFFGVILILSSKKSITSKYILLILSILLLLSVVIWIRPVFSFGSITILLFSVLFVLIAISKKVNLQVAFISFIGVQAIISVYLSIGYLFSPRGDILRSDTFVMQEVLLLPYWFWGGVIIIISALAFLYSFKILLFSKSKNDNKMKSINN